FAESLCNGRRNRGYGPNYIANELQSRGIASETASATLAAYEGSWFELAVAAVDKKYMRDIEAWSR
ncbi:MAG TPA: RecX family transcriptional regulator, partial [Gammaproteobacteria bacterium]|nr:RecX family transcriptional regulator [Gammaproteobacteria bacterium]